MLDNGKISSRQFSILITLYIIGSAVLTIPGLLAIDAKQDAWIAAVLAFIVCLLILPIYIHLGKRFSRSNFTSYIEKLLSKWLGKVVLLLFIITFPFLVAVLTLRNIGDFITTEVMEHTPAQAVYIIFIIVVILGVRLGLEPLARAAELFFPFVIILFVLFFVLVTPQINFDNIQPVLENGFKPILSASFTFIAYPFVESIILTMLFPFIKHTKNNGKALFTGIFIGGIVLVIITTLTILCLGTNTVSLSYPSYALAKNINIGLFVDRIEGIMAMIWFITIFIRLALVFHICVVGIAHILNLKEYRFLTFPTSIVLIVLSQVFFPNDAYFYQFTPIWTIHALIMGFLFPLILWIIGSFKKC